MPSATRRNSMRDSEEPAQCDDKSLIDNNMLETYKAQRVS